MYIISTLVTAITLNVCAALNYRNYQRAMSTTYLQEIMGMIYVIYHLCRRQSIRSEGPLAESGGALK